MPLARSKFFPSAPPPPQLEGQERAPGRSTGTVAAEWQCGCHLLFSLLPQHSDPLLSVPLHHPPPFMKGSGTMGLEAGTGESWTGKHADWQKALASAPGAQPGSDPRPEQWAQSKCSEIQRTCCCVPGSRRGGVLLCGLF